MDTDQARIVCEAQFTAEDCQREIDDFEAYCDLICGKLAPMCNVCDRDIPVIIAMLKKRMAELLKKECEP